MSVGAVPYSHWRAFFFRPRFAQLPRLTADLPLASYVSLVCSKPLRYGISRISTEPMHVSVFIVSSNISQRLSYCLIIQTRQSIVLLHAWSYAWDPRPTRVFDEKAERKALGLYGKVHFIVFTWECRLVPVLVHMLTVPPGPCLAIRGFLNHIALEYVWCHY